MLGCGGGGSSGGGAAVAGGGTLISGQAVKGPVNGALLSAFAMDATGVKTGAALGTATGDSSGVFLINVGAHTGPLLIECTGGSYTDEATGAAVTLTATKKLTLALPKAEAVTAPVAITPLTSMAIEMAKSQAAGQGLATAIANANAQIGAKFGITDIVAAIPIDLKTTAPVALSTAQTDKYAVPRELGTTIGTTMTDNNQGIDQ